MGEKEIPRGYWTHLGVWLNFALTVVALALAIHFVTDAGGWSDLAEASFS